MAYLVNLTVRAERDLDGLYVAIDAGNSGAALGWYRGLREAILSLEVQPNRCPATPERGEFGHLLYGHKPHIYRVIFRILEKRNLIEVLHLRHGARRRFKASDVD